MQETSKKYLLILICVVLAVAATDVYRQAINFNFLNLQDSRYIYENSFIKDGLTPQSIAWAFSFADQARQLDNWQPLTSLSHIIDVELFGLKAWGHHLTSVLLHTINTLLLFAVLQYMTSKPWRSAFVAALFALHPLHVESVVWVSQRKDVLGMLFVLLAIFSYAWYARRPKIYNYILTLFLFAAGLMSNPILVTLPFLLLLLDDWPLGRFKTEDNDNPCKTSRLIIEKIPFLILSAAICFITIKVRGWSDMAHEELPMKLRLLNIPVSYVKYIEKTFWPRNLAFLYPFPKQGISLLHFWISSSALLVISFLVLFLGRRRKYLTFGWLWYLITSIPVIGIIHIGSHSMADQYTYIPLTGLFIIISWGAADLLAKIRYRRIIFSISAAIILVALGAAAWRQTGFWQDDITLYQHAAKAVDDNHQAYKLLGNAQYHEGRLDEAINSYKKSLRINPDSIEVSNDLAIILLTQEKYDDVIALYRKILPELRDTYTQFSAEISQDTNSFKPKETKKYEITRYYSQAHNNLGIALERQGKPDEAVIHYEEAVRLRPSYAFALKNLAYVLLQLNKYDQAIEYYKKLVQLEPDSAEVRRNISYALFKNKRYDEAITQMRQYLRLQPDSAFAYNTLANIYLQQDNVPDAVEAFNKALELAETAGQDELARQIQAQLNGLESQ